MARDIQKRVSLSFYKRKNGETVWQKGDRSKLQKWKQIWAVM